MTHILIFSIIIIGLLLLATMMTLGELGYITIWYEEAFGDVAPNYTWAWTENEGYFKVYWLAFEEGYERYNEWPCKGEEVACGDIIDGVHVIAYREDTMFNETIPGCNVWTHENLHHWGYNEEMIRDFFPCDQPSKYKTLPKIGFKN